jgi:hypothetical protein
MLAVNPILVRRGLYRYRRCYSAWHYHRRVCYGRRGQSSLTTCRLGSGLQPGRLQGYVCCCGRCGARDPRMGPPGQQHVWRCRRVTALVLGLLVPVLCKTRSLNFNKAKPPWGCNQVEKYRSLEDSHGIIRVRIVGVGAMGGVTAGCIQACVTSGCGVADCDARRAKLSLFSMKQAISRSWQLLMIGCYQLTTTPSL